MKQYIIFRDRKTGRELLCYSLQGSFPGELESTKELLAYENGVRPDQIRATIENRVSNPNNTE